MNEYQDVAAFHRKFGLDNVHQFGTGPRELPLGLLEFRLKFLQEELAEFVKGMDDNDIAQMADALVDLVYVAMGTAHILGLPWYALWNEIQRANMSKERAAVDGSNSKRGSAFDVVKPEGWQSPRIEAILEAFGWNQMQMGC